MATQHLTQSELAQRWRCEGIGPIYLKIKGRVVYREIDIEDFERQCMQLGTKKSVSPQH